MLKLLKNGRAKCGPASNESDLIFNAFKLILMNFNGFHSFFIVFCVCLVLLMIFEMLSSSMWFRTHGFQAPPPPAALPIAARREVSWALKAMGSKSYGGGGGADPGGFSARGVPGVANPPCFLNIDVNRMVMSAN